MSQHATERTGMETDVDPVCEVEKGVLAESCDPTFPLYPSSLLGCRCPRRVSCP